MISDFGLSISDLTPNLVWHNMSKRFSLTKVAHFQFQTNTNLTVQQTTDN